MKKLSWDKPRGFALKAAADFYSGFTPGCGMAAASGDRLSLAFLLDGTFQAVVVELREQGQRLLGELRGSDDAGAASRQVARMLGLDADADAWLALGQRDTVVAKLQRQFAGFFTAAKPSPYDAAAWGVISPRLNMRAAARLKMALGRTHGQALTSGRQEQHVFPAPEQVLAIESFPGLPALKLERLKGIARAALEGKLEAERLRAMPENDALLELQTLPGVGPWTASHILIRGAGLSDALPTAEPRVLHGMADAYGIDQPSIATMVQLSQGWRPFRTWVCILLARHLASIGGWHKPGLSRERTAAGRRLLATATGR